MADERKVDPRLESFREYLDQRIAEQYKLLAEQVDTPIREGDLRAYRDLLALEKNAPIKQRLRFYQEARQIYRTLLAVDNPELYEIQIVDLALSVRPTHTLGISRIENVGQLLEQTDADLLGIRSFGGTCLKEVKSKLKEKLGLVM